MGSLLQSFEDLIITFANLLFGPCIAQSSIKYVYSAHLLEAFTKIFTLVSSTFLCVAKNL